MKSAVKRGKRISLWMSAAFLGMLIMVAMVPGLAQESGSPSPMTLAQLEPWVFPAKGVTGNEAQLFTAPGGEAAQTLPKGTEIEATDYANGYFVIALEGETFYIAPQQVNLTFVKPASAKVTAGGATTFPAKEGGEARALEENGVVSVYGCEDGWWLLQSLEGTEYVKIEALTLPLPIARVIDQPGEYGGEAMERMEGSLVVSAPGVTLRNIIVDGNLYILSNVGSITLADAYVLYATLPQGNLEIVSSADRLLEQGLDPAQSASDLYRLLYAGDDMEGLEEELNALLETFDNAFGEGK